MTTATKSKQIKKSSKDTEPSKAIELLSLVWRESGSSTSHSYERLNHSMRQALMLAIGSGFAFQLSDFEHIANNFSASRWMGADTESFYARSIVEGNTSAAMSYEAWKGREPFIADDVDLPELWGGTFAHMAGSRTKERLHVGCKFTWKTERVTVTSFRDDGSAVIACSYVDMQARKELEEYFAPDGSTLRKLMGPPINANETKINRRYTITRQDIITDRAERKDRKALAEEIRELSKSREKSVEWMLAKIGVTTQKEYDLAPLKKIRELVKKIMEMTGKVPA